MGARVLLRAGPKSCCMTNTRFASHSVESVVHGDLASTEGNDKKKENTSY